MEIRKSRIFQEPQQLILNSKDPVPWANLGLREFNEQWAYKPYYIYGQFDHAREIKVARVKEGNKKDNLGERGFQIITPFYCYVNELGQNCAILVDRGWVESEEGKSFSHRATPRGPCRITGVLYKGNSDNKYR